VLKHGNVIEVVALKSARLVQFVAGLQRARVVARTANAPTTYRFDVAVRSSTVASSDR
jgi:hypothetical protein